MVEDHRLAEMVAALSLATDIGMGQPMGQGLRTCLVALLLADVADIGPEERAEVFYVVLLRFLGCTADAHETAASVGGDDIALRRAIAPVMGGRPREFLTGVLPVVGTGLPPARRGVLIAGMLVRGKARARAGVRAHCEAAEILATRLGLPHRVKTGLGSAFERWDGAGLPHGLVGEAIPFSARVALVARDVEVLYRVGGRELVGTALAERSSYDPALAELATRNLDNLLAAASHDTPWEAVLAAEPRPQALVRDLEATLEVLADFTDLKSPYFAGHSRAVAALAAAAGPDDAELLRHAGLVQDLGRVGVPSGVWARPEPLGEADFEAVRLHPYFTERILSRASAAAPLARIASLHHEHLDGSGYHRGVSASDIPFAARVLAAADAWRRLTSMRPYRAALEPSEAGSRLREDVAAGRLDPVAVENVVAAAHERPIRPARPAGLTGREAEVLRHLCTGATKKDVAAALVISPSTADHHIRHIYTKLGVRSRAAATLYAAEHGLV